MNKKKSLFILIILIFSCLSYPRISIKKIEPPNWWIGMKHNKIQLMVYGEDLKGVSAVFNNENIKILKVHNAESASYCFIDVVIPENLPAGDYQLKLFKDNSQADIIFPLFSRDAGEKI